MRRPKPRPTDAPEADRRLVIPGFALLGEEESFPMSLVLRGRARVSLVRCATPGEAARIIDWAAHEGRRPIGMVILFDGPLETK